GGWRPLALARITLEASSYRPITAVPRLRTPVLFVAATRDALCPAAAVAAAAAAVPGGRGSVLELDSSHFDVYHGDKFRTAADAMLRFARQHLRAAGAGGQEAGRL
ncbi:hypothetical protein TSOC_000229, partial [Tetrabaena socialis]